MKKGYCCCFVVDVKGDVDDELIFAVVVAIVSRKLKQWMDQLLPIVHWRDPQVSAPIMYEA